MNDNKEEYTLIKYIESAKHILFLLGIGRYSIPLAGLSGPLLRISMSTGSIYPGVYELICIIFGGILFYITYGYFGLKISSLSTVSDGKTYNPLKNWMLPRSFLQKLSKEEHKSVCSILMTIRGKEKYMELMVLYREISRFDLVNLHLYEVRYVIPSL